MPLPANWYVNREWSPAIAEHFFVQLQRTRRKQHCLVTQACLIARSYPEVALKLLDRYFELPSKSSRAQAHLSRAVALIALGRAEEASTSLQEVARLQALERRARKRNPNSGKRGREA